MMFLRFKDSAPSNFTVAAHPGNGPVIMPVLGQF
jgi:hypothetical protein